MQIQLRSELNYYINVHYHGFPKNESITMTAVTSRWSDLQAYHNTKWSYCKKYN